jgi:hypothetical protein
MIACVLDQPELMTQDFVDDYHAKLNDWWAAKHKEWTAGLTTRRQT